MLWLTTVIEEALVTPDPSLLVAVPHRPALAGSAFLRLIGPSAHPRQCYATVLIVARQELVRPVSVPQRKIRPPEQSGDHEGEAMSEQGEDEKKKLPDDITEDERKDYERTGTLELYELNREGDRIARERIKLNQEIADRARAEEDKRAKRHQLEQQRLENETLKRRLLEPPPPDPYADAKPLEGSERLPEPVKGALRRLFGMHSGDWSPENQQGLVNLLLAMGNEKALRWANQLKDGLAADVYMSHELSPKAVLKGSTGLKQIAGPALMPDLKAIGGPREESVKQVSDGRQEGGRKKKRRKKRRNRTESSDDVIEEGDEKDDEVIDDSPMGNAESPWGDGGFSPY